MGRRRREEGALRPDLILARDLVDDAFTYDRIVWQNPRQQSSEGLLHDVKFVFQQERAANLIPAAFLAFGILDAVPIPTDAGYFAVQRWLDTHRDELSEKKFWWYTYLNYYGWDVSWYLMLFGATYFMGKTVGQKAGIGIAIVSFGAILAEILAFSGHGRRTSVPPQQTLPPAPAPMPTPPQAP
jgi:hypothetical protein